MNHAETVRKLLRQQTAIAEFGSFALHQTDLAIVLNEAARVCAVGFGTPFAKICRYRPVENDLIIEAGYGWNDGVVGHVVERPDATTPQGKVFSSREPVICNALRDHVEFILPPFYAEHRIVSTVGVVIKAEGHPYGILEVDSDKPQVYDKHDIDFLTSFANVVSEAVATAGRIRVLGDTIERMKLLAENQDRLLDQKRVLAEELQHRVRNNLQLVYSMLTRQLDESDGTASQHGLKGIARRVFTLAQVYDQLLGTEMTRTMDFCGYLKSLCTNLAEVQGQSGTSIVLECSCNELRLDLDVVTSLGIMVAELVTNSFDHAFPERKGKIWVSLNGNPDTSVASFTVRDDGPGFIPAAESKRHGLGLVRRLSEQIGGTATVTMDHGTLWTITFPVETPAGVAPLTAA